MTFITSAYTQDDVVNLGSFTELNFKHSSEVVLKRQDLVISQCDLPEEVERAFNLGTSLDYKPIYGLQQIEISAEINYADLQDIGKWRGSSGDLAEQNVYKYVELPVGVSCTFSGVVRAQYTVDASQDHEVTDTYHTAGTYGSETKNDITGEQYRSDRPIKIIAEGNGSNYFQWNLGEKNYISSFDVTGGDADGGNVEASMSFQNDHSEIFLLKGSTILDLTSNTTY